MEVAGTGVGSLTSVSGLKQNAFISNGNCSLYQKGKVSLLQ